jgi:hypothetical protein
LCEDIAGDVSAGALINGCGKAEFDEIDAKMTAQEH